VLETLRVKPMNPAISIVLPVDDSEHALEHTVRSYVDELDRFGRGWELLLVPQMGDGDGTSYERLTSISEGIRVSTPADGWGGRVRVGLRASSGEVLCYTNWKRTSARALSDMLDVALRNPELALRANRRTRDTRTQRLGSLLFNLECRFLLQIPCWDINGTPKVFPRAFSKLLDLKRDDDLIDAEFALVCERAAYPVIEIPVDAELVSGASVASSLDYRAALRMYAGVRGLRTQVEGSL
jgi:hypothetical protein